MPLLMAIAEWMYLRTESDPCIILISASGGRKGTAIFVCGGGVSGNGLFRSKLGFAWPGFMEHAGAIIGMPFS